MGESFQLLFCYRHSDQAAPATVGKAAEGLAVCYFKAAFVQECETEMSALEVFTLFGGEI